MGTLAGLPSLSPKLDNETKDLMQTIAKVDRHGFAKIIYLTTGFEKVPAFDKDGNALFLKNGNPKMDTKGFLKAKRPLEIVQPDGTTKSAKQIYKLTMKVVGMYDYKSLIDNNLAKNDIDPENFSHENCRYSQKYSDNGFIRQNKNPAKDLNFYMRYILGLNANTSKSSETIYLNENKEVIEIPQSYKDEYFKTSAPSQKQAEAGVSKEIKVRNISLDNVVYFQKGDEKIFNERVTDKILNLLDLEWV